MRAFLVLALVLSFSAPAAAQHRADEATAGIVAGLTGVIVAAGVYQLAVPWDGGFWRDEPRWDDPLAISLGLGIGALSGVAAWALAQGHEERLDVVGIPMVSLPIAGALAVVWVVACLFAGFEHFDARAFQIATNALMLLGPTVGLIGGSIHFALEGDAPLPPRE